MAQDEGLDDEAFEAWQRDHGAFLDRIAGQPMPGAAVADGVWLVGLPPAVQELTAEGDADGLLALLEEPDLGRLSYKAGMCLAGVLGDRRAVGPLLRHLRGFDLTSPSEAEIEDWKTVAFALASLEPPGSPAADELLATLEEREFKDVGYAGQLLAAIGDRRAIDPLARRLRATDPTLDESRGDWYWLTSALWKLRASEAVDTLIAALPVTTNVLMQEDTAIALEEIDDPRAIPALIAALESHHGRYDPATNAIINALNHFGTTEARRAVESWERSMPPP